MNNKKSIIKFQILSSILIAILGTILHFTYNWSNENLLVSTFSSINESTWEHLKLLFFPTLITIIIGNFYIGKKIPNFLCAKTISIIISISFTTIFFYTYTGILGTNFAILNIAIFFIAIILGEFIAYKLMISNFTCNSKISLIILIILLIFFILFTFSPPRIGLFKDPISEGYGINF